MVRLLKIDRAQFPLPSKEEILSNILVFLGSGVSLESGAPSTKGITDEVFRPNQWEGDENLENMLQWPTGEGSNRDIIERGILPFLEVVKKYIVDGLPIENRPPVNYEDIFYLLDQIVDYEGEELSNPALSPFVSQMEDLSHDLRAGMAKGGDSLRMQLFAHRGKDYIRYVAWRLLSQEFKIRNMDILGDLASSDQISRLDVFSLNHDLILERHLQSRSIPFIDGFGPESDGVRVYDGTLYDGEGKVRVHKLHGSVNQFLVKLRSDDGFKHRFAIPTESNLWYSEDRHGNHLFNPAMLIGGQNKMIEYGMGEFRRLFSKFDTALDATNHVIVSGYGWRDFGITRTLLEWVRSSSENRLLIYHEKPKDLLDKAPHKLRSHVGKYPQRISFIEHFLGDVGVPDVLNDIRHVT